MTTPTLTLLPLRPSLLEQQSQEVTVAVRITPPAIHTDQPRPPLNLALVLDRSGSMSGEKLRVAQRAAQAVIDLLQPTDRVSVVAFDTVVEVVVPSTLAIGKASIKAAIAAIRSLGTTALHGGWVEGATQVAQHLTPGALNRVLLLSDGQANVGVTNADQIASDVRGLVAKGISTSTFGMGDDYDEVLLEALAVSGDGNYLHIGEDHLAHLSDVFVAELQGLSATSGRLVSLGLSPAPGVTLKEVLNDLPRTPDTDRLMLPNLVAGAPVEVVFRLQVDAPSQDLTPVARLRLAWTNAEGHRQALRQDINLLVMDAQRYEAQPVNVEVQALVAVLEAARAKQAAIAALEDGDLTTARDHVRWARHMADAIPEMAPARFRTEAADLDVLDSVMAEGNLSRSKKVARSQVFDRLRSKPRVGDQQTPAQPTPDDQQGGQ